MLKPEEKLNVFPKLIVAQPYIAPVVMGSLFAGTKRPFYPLI